MNRKSLWLITCVLALAAALAGCGLQPQPWLESTPAARQPTALPGGLILDEVAQPMAPANMAASDPELKLEATATSVESRTTEDAVALTPEGPAGKGPTGQAPENALMQAKKDLAKKLGLPIDRLTVVLVIGEDFTPDGFYCRTNKGRASKEEPKPTISGQTILLEAQGLRYEYHASDQTTIFCRPLQ